MKKEIKITTDKKLETPNNNDCFTINEEYFNELSKLIIKLKLNSLNNEEEISKALENVQSKYGENASSFTNRVGRIIYESNREKEFLKQKIY